MIQRTKDWLNSKVRVNAAGCWVWQCGLVNGYGHTSLNKQGIGAHRLSYILYNHIPEGQYVLHKCDNPPCCNPEHLFLGDAMVNNHDRIAKGRNGRIGHNLRSLSKLTEAQVAEVRRLWSTQPISQSAIARQFNIHQSSVSRIVRNEYWL